MGGFKILAAVIPVSLVVMCRGKLKELQIKHLLVFLAPVKSKNSFLNWNIVIKKSTGVLICWEALAHSRGFDYVDVIAP